MNCDELRHELADVASEPSDLAEAHLATCAECQVWLNEMLARPIPELQTIPALVPPTVFARIALPEEQSSRETFWKKLFWSMSAGMVALALVMIMLTAPQVQKPTIPGEEAWTFLPPDQKTDWSFVEQSGSMDIGLAFSDQREQVGDFGFLDTETTYTFLEEEQS